MAARTQLLYPIAKLDNRPVASLEVSASLAVPWRTLRSDGYAVRGEVTAFAGYHKPGVWEVFRGVPDTPRTVSSGQGRLTARGLPALRVGVKPQAFQDADLQTVLGWIGSQVSQPLALTVEGTQRRHYNVSAGSAWSAIKAALLSWRLIDYVAVELDDYSLYIGPEESSPHATAPMQATLEHLVNIYEFHANARGASLVIPAYPWLRVGHRVTLAHPVLSGTVRLTEALHTMTRLETTTSLEVLNT